MSEVKSDGTIEAKMISIFNKDYCEFEEFKLNETPL